MVKTIREFKDELKTLRREMVRKGERADTKLVASWVDRLVISLEGLTPTLGLMSEELNQLAEAEECVLVRTRMKKGKKKKTAKKKIAKKRIMKKKAVKKRRR